MSRDNVEPLPIQTACEAISRLDGEALVALCDPNVRFESRITAVEDETYDGHQGVRQYMVNLTEAFGPPLQAVSSGLIAGSSHPAGRCGRIGSLQLDRGRTGCMQSL